MGITFYRNLKEALDSLGEGEALFTYTYPILFPLTIVYSQERDSGRYLGQNLIVGRISKQSSLSYSRSSGGQSKFGVGQVYFKGKRQSKFGFGQVYFKGKKEKGEDSPLIPVPGLSGSSMTTFYRLALVRSEDLSKGLEGYYSSLDLNRSAFTPSFYSFISSGLKEIKSNIGGGYVGLGTYILEDKNTNSDITYRISSLVFRVIRENIESSLKGIDIDLSAFDHSPIEGMIEQYLSFFESESKIIPPVDLFVQFVDRDLGGGSLGKMVATKWFEDNGLVMLDLEGLKHLPRVLAEEARSAGLTTSPEDLASINKMLPAFIGEFFVYLSSPGKVAGGSGNSSNLIAVPIGHRIKEQKKSNGGFEEFEVDYLILSKMKLRDYGIRFEVAGPIRGVDYKNYSPKSLTLYHLIDRFYSRKMDGILVLEESKFVGKERYGSNVGSGKKVIRAIVDFDTPDGGKFVFLMKNKHEHVSFRNLKSLLKNPNVFLINSLTYLVDLSKTYYLDFELDDDLKVRLIGSSSTDLVINGSSLALEFYANDDLLLEEETYSINCPDLFVKRVYKSIENLRSFLSSKESYFERDKAERKAVSYSLSLLGELERILLNMLGSNSGRQGYSDKIKCHRSNNVFHLRIPNFGSLASPSFPLNPGQIFKMEDFGFPTFRKLSRLRGHISEGQELCARVGEESHRLLFRGGMGEVEAVVSNVFGKDIEIRHRSEVEASRSKAGLRSVYPTIEDFSWSISSHIASSLMAYEKDNFLELGTPWLEWFVRKMVDQLISILTEWGETSYSFPNRNYAARKKGSKAFYILNAENFLKSIEAIYIKNTGRSFVSTDFYCDRKGNFVPDDISVTFSYAGILSNSSFGADDPDQYYFSTSMKLEAIYLPSGIQGKSLKIKVSPRSGIEWVEP